MDPDGDMIDTHIEETENGERLTISPLSVKFLEEVEEEVQAPPNLDTPRESIELIKFNEEKVFGGLAVKWINFKQVQYF